MFTNESFANDWQPYLPLQLDGYIHIAGHSAPLGTARIKEQKALLTRDLGEVADPEHETPHRVGGPRFGPLNLGQFTGELPVI